MKNAAKRIFSCKIGADTAENEQHFAEILPTDAHAYGADAARYSLLRSGAREWSEDGVPVAPCQLVPVEKHQ